MKSKAIIGLDGLAPHDLVDWGFDQTKWDELKIETFPTTITSWNAIFSGNEIEDCYGFTKLPDDLSDISGNVLENDIERYTYEDVLTDGHLWERDDVDVTVVAAPVYTPGYTEVGADTDLFFPTKKHEFTKAMRKLTEYTINEDRVITVFPFPDKMNHMADSAGSEYTHTDKDIQMKEVISRLREIEREFDEVVVLSDHGRPWNKYHITDDVWVPSHVSMGVIKSTEFDTQGHTNVTIYDKLLEFLQK